MWRAEDDAPTLLAVHVMRAQPGAVAQGEKRSVIAKKFDVTPARSLTGSHRRQLQGG